MCPHDPADSSSVTNGDDPTPGHPRLLAADATHSSGFDPAGATVALADPSPENAPTLGLHNAFTIDHAAADPPTAAAPPPVLEYELLALLGEGGMGVVWKARQVKLNRLVALKMVLGEQRAGSKELIRFLAEAEAVAAVKHPHVVQVYDYGEANGRPFLAMEYLPGGSLSDRLKRTGRLDPKAAAELLSTLAGAVQAAHDVGIVHRDLKAGNVLYDQHGQPKVTDFGLAKRAGGGNLTATQAVMGTPAYMAPEQARGDTKFVGPQADVYSLGVILYECLTDTRPFEAPDQLALLRKVAEEEPERPGKRVQGLPRDVELICLKCLAKDLTERYPTARALAADLDRFAAGEPVSVRAAWVVERAAKWARRKPALAVAYTLGLLCVPLVVLAAGSGIAAVTVSRQNQALGKANTLAEQKRQLAVAAARAANEQNRSAVDAHVDLITLMGSKLRFVPAIQDEREQIVDNAKKRLEAGVRAMTDLRRDVEWAPEDEGHNWRSLARAHQALGRLSLMRNQVTDGMAQFRQAEEIIAELATADPENLNVQIDWVRTQRQLGDVSMNRLGDTEGAQRYFRRAIEISRACLAKKPDQDVYKSELANSLGPLAGSELTLGHLEKARDLYREGIAVRESFSPAEAKKLESRRELASHYEQLAELNVRMGDLVEGQRLYDQCVALRQEVAAEQPDFWPAQNDLAVSYNQQGSMRFPQGRDAAAARQFHRKALLVLEKRAKAEPSDLENKHTLAQTLYYEATCALHSGDKPGSDAGFRQCLEICKELTTGPKAKIWETDLMLALARCGDHAQAARIAEALVATPPKDEHLYVESACGYALAAGAAGDDAVLVQRYKTAAIDCLRKSKERGWADVASLEKDTDLEPIHDDPAFQALLREFRRPGEKRP